MLLTLMGACSATGSATGPGVSATTVESTSRGSGSGPGAGTGSSPHSAEAVPAEPALQRAEHPRRADAPTLPDRWDELRVGAWYQVTLEGLDSCSFTAHAFDINPPDLWWSLDWATMPEGSGVHRAFRDREAGSDRLAGVGRILANGDLQFSVDGTTDTAVYRQRLSPPPGCE